ncbi:hypothetical protein HOLleu_34310 [Holothuria leucospilota]|uniref:Uncharacterized protein n=1 Tax=Holothuria leucospilota TaxID=206669 RepID=A0A9Q1BGK7_HOLLE|nr:hypothetical protein HOLleu_34310 [Holothuria leucospilota]
MASVQVPNLQEHRPPPKASQFSTRPPHTPRGELDEPDVDPAEAAALWAIATRRNIDLFVESNLPVKPEEVNKLIKELSAVFIAALQRDSLKQWQYVNEVLKILQPYVSLFVGNKQLDHYIQRIVFHARKLSDQSLANEILKSVDKLFVKSDAMKKVSNGDHRNYRTPIPPGGTNGSSTLKSTAQFSLPDGSDPYRPPSHGDDVTMKPKGISFGDLTDVMPSVIKETVKHDAIWSEGLGLTAAALNIKLPHSKSETPSRDSMPPRQPDSTWVSSDKENKAKKNVKISTENVSGMLFSEEKE